MTLSFHYSTHRRKSQYFLCFFAIFLLLTSVVFSAKSASASAQNFYFSDFSADYYLSRDDEGVSHLKVVEQLTAVFPDTDQNHGITRIIPFTNNNGQNLTMASDNSLDITVTRNNQPENIYRTESGDGYFKVMIGDPAQYVHGEQVYTLTYEFENVILDQSSGVKAWQELYWDANGNDWSQRFEHVTARIHLDDASAAAFDGRTACYVGSYGESGSSRCEVTTGADLVTFSADHLAASETLTFVLGFAADTFVIRAMPSNPILLVMAGGMLCFAFMLIFLTTRSARRVQTKMDYYQGLFVKPEYTAPRDFTVAELAANYIGKGLRGNPKVATLLELAVNHQITLIKAEQPKALGRAKTTWVVRVDDPKDLTPAQTKILQILQGSSDQLLPGQEITVKSHTATTALAELAKNFDTDVKTAIRQKGLLAPKSTQLPGPHAGPLLALDVVWLIMVTSGVVSMFTLPNMYPYQSYLGAGWLPPIVLVLGWALSFYLFTRTSMIAKLEQHTEKGLDYSRYLDGLKLYISMAEADRLNFLQSVKGADTSHDGIVRLYEKLLPYAALFGLEKSWLAELSRYYEFDDVVQPTWYLGTGPFLASDFTAAMSSITSLAGTTISHSTTVDSSSSDSGFSSGGGFSGGGGGGGGGGGW